MTIQSIIAFLATLYVIACALPPLARGDWGGAASEALKRTWDLKVVIAWLTIPWLVIDLAGIPKDGSASSTAAIVAVPALMFCVSIWAGLRDQKTHRGFRLGLPGGHRDEIVVGLVGAAGWFQAFYLSPAEFGFADPTSASWPTAVLWAISFLTAVVAAYGTWLLFLDNPSVQSRHAIRSLLGISERDAGARWSTQAEMSRRFAGGRGGIVIGEKVENP